jgi:hypothetical protein
MTDSIKAREIISRDIVRVRRSYRVSFERMRRKLPAFKPQWDAGAGATALSKVFRWPDVSGIRRLKISTYWHLAMESSMLNCATPTRCTVVRRPPQMPHWSKRHHEC